MNQYVAQLPWTDEQWARINQTVRQEAERTRVAAKFLPIYGPVPDQDLSVPNLALDVNPAPIVQNIDNPANRLIVNSDSETTLATISMIVYVRSHEAADPELQAALTMFRRAATIIARVEDALMFNGQNAPDTLPRGAGGPLVLARVSNGREQAGLVQYGANPKGRIVVNKAAPAAPQTDGTTLVSAVVDAITRLESNGYGPPFACVLGNNLFRFAHEPTDNLVLPRQPIVSMLEGGPLLRSSVIPPDTGAVISHESGQVEQVLASDICVKFLQISEEPRFVFRVSERLALRVRDWRAVVSIN